MLKQAQSRKPFSKQDQLPLARKIDLRSLLLLHATAAAGLNLGQSFVFDSEVLHKAFAVLLRGARPGKILSDGVFWTTVQS